MVVEVNDSSFVNNSATHDGGSFFVKSVGDSSSRAVHIRRSNFSDSSALRSGGCMAVVARKNEDFRFEELRFDRCTANTGDGGGLAVDVGFDLSRDPLGFTDASVYVMACSFVNNTAGGENQGGGGGLGVISPSSNTSVSVSECLFKGNSATGLSGGFEGYGGGLFIKPTGALGDKHGEKASCNLRVVVSACTFVGNFGGHGGGGMTMQVDGSLWTDSSVEIERCQFLANTAGSVCSGLYLQFNAEQVETAVMIKLCEFRHGIAGNGDGALYLYYEDLKRTTATVQSCVFFNNTAFHGKGGGVAVYMQGSVLNPNFLFEDCLFRENNAADSPGDGGGLALTNNAGCNLPEKCGPPTIKIQNCNFSQNFATGNGGALYVETAGTESAAAMAIQITNSTMESNVAGRYGGAVYAGKTVSNKPTNLEFSLTNKTGRLVAPCYAPYNATFREWNYDAFLTVTLCTLVSNKATSALTTDASGGALACANIDVTIVSSWISNNSADTSAGAISLLPGSARMRIEGNTTISDNRVVGGNLGSVIHSSSGGMLEFSGTSTITFGDLNGDTATDPQARGGAGVFVMQGGRIVFEQDAVLQCPRGELFVQNITQAPGVLGSGWTIDCTVLLTVRNVTDSGVLSGLYSIFAIPSCYQLCPYSEGSSACGEECVCGQCCNASLSAEECKACVTTKCPERPCDPLTVSNQAATCQTKYVSTLPISPPMNFSLGILSCSPCPSGLYSLERGELKGGELSGMQCQTCPTGADCTEGGSQLKAKHNFYGLDLGNNALRFVQCPRKYCCSNRERNGCNWRGNTACQGNRDPRVPLCGDCMPGYSQCIDSNACVEDSQCGLTNTVLLYLLSQLLYWGVFDFYFLYQAQYMPALRLVQKAKRTLAWLWFVCSSWCYHDGVTVPDVRLRGNQQDGGAIGALFYYYQLAMLVVPQGYSKLATRTASALVTVGRFCNLERFVTTSGVCIATGTNGVHQMLAGLASPLVMLSLLLLMQLLMQNCRSTRTPESSGRKQTSSPSIPLNNPTDELPNEQANAEEPLLSQEVEGGTTGEAVQKVHAKQKFVFACAVACLLLFMYTSFAVYAIQLLNCIDVGGGKHVLRYAGGHECQMTWQAPIILLVVILILLPLAPLGILLLDATPWGRHRDASASAQGPLPDNSPRRDRHCTPASSRRILHEISQYTLVRALTHHAKQPFKPKYWYWASVLVLQRLLTVMCSALSTTGVESSVGVALVSLIFLLLQMLANPYTLAWVNRLQTCASVCLLVLAILNSASGAFMSTGFDPYTDGDGTLQHFQMVVEVAMLLTLFPPPILCIWAVVYHRTAVTAQSVLEEQPDTGLKREEQLRRLLDEANTRELELTTRLRAALQRESDKSSAADRPESIGAQGMRSIHRKRAL
jgi:predicted outer membrane repeat protein